MVVAEGAPDGSEHLAFIQTCLIRGKTGLPAWGGSEVPVGKERGDSKGITERDSSRTAGPKQYELFPTQDRCPECGGRLTTRQDGFGRAYGFCSNCKRRTYLQR